MANLQLWLYFGPLSAFLDEDIPRQKILKKDPDFPDRDLIDSCSVERLIRAGYKGPKGLGLSEVDGEYLQRRRISAYAVFRFAVQRMNEVVIGYLS